VRYWSGEFGIGAKRLPGVIAGISTIGGGARRAFNSEAALCI
jgi:hypothetical protein